MNIHISIKFAVFYESNKNIYIFNFKIAEISTSNKSRNYT